MSIPKRIFTIWLSEQEVPELINRCVRSQDILGYEHRLITLENVYRGSVYVNRCLEKKDWVRAADYLRLHYLNEVGGIYLDADTEVKPYSNFDHLLGTRMFVFKEESGYLNNGYIGAEAKHPWLDFMVRTMETCFRSDQNLFFPGMQFFCESYYIADRDKLKMSIHNEDEIKKLVHHHGLKSWVGKES